MHFSGGGAGKKKPEIIPLNQQQPQQQFTSQHQQQRSTPQQQQQPSPPQRLQQPSPPLVCNDSRKRKSESQLPQVNNKVAKQSPPPPNYSPEQQQQQRRTPSRPLHQQKQEPRPPQQQQQITAGDSAALLELLNSQYAQEIQAQAAAAQAHGAAAAAAQAAQAAQAASQFQAPGGFPGYPGHSPYGLPHPGLFHPGFSPGVHPMLPPHPVPGVPPQSPHHEQLFKCFACPATFDKREAFLYHIQFHQQGKSLKSTMYVNSFIQISSRSNSSSSRVSSQHESCSCKS